MILNNENSWDYRDDDRHNIDENYQSFSRQNEDDFSENDLEDNELGEDDRDYDNGRQPMFNQADLDDEDGDYEQPDEVPDEDDEEELPDDEPEEGSGYHRQSEVDQPNKGADTSYSENIDVTPPNKKEFPSEGPAKTDFESRPQGRTTGRMLGHEPGTEGI